MHGCHTASHTWIFSYTLTLPSLPPLYLLYCLPRYAPRTLRCCTPVSRSAFAISAPPNALPCTLRATSACRGAPRAHVLAHTAPCHHAAVLYCGHILHFLSRRCWRYRGLLPAAARQNSTFACARTLAGALSASSHINRHLRCVCWFTYCTPHRYPTRLRARCACLLYVGSPAAQSHCAVHHHRSTSASQCAFIRDWRHSSSLPSSILPAYHPLL